MSDTLINLQRKITGASELQSVVRTMKAVAASSIAQYEKAVQSLAEYYSTVESGLVAVLRQTDDRALPAKNEPEQRHSTLNAVVFGSDQGLVGQFNDVLTNYVVGRLAKIPGEKNIWSVGGRVQVRLEEAGLKPIGQFAVPTSVSAITQLVRQILIESEPQSQDGIVCPMYLFHNRPKTGALYEPVCQKILPIDDIWLKKYSGTPWPTNNLPEVVGAGVATFQALIHEYLFVSIFQACAESLASENASRLAAMQRAEKNIEEMLKDLNSNFHHLRQSSIDEELSDLISGFEAMKKTATKKISPKHYSE